MLALSIVAAVTLAAGVWAEANYSGPLRPQLHFSPLEGFMNDPNGMFLDADGVWHLYYQCKQSTHLLCSSIANIQLDNPTDIVAGNQHWGHTTSEDLYHWENQPIAIAPNPGEGIFSGSIVVDVNNTSGFFPNQTDGVVAIYTLHTDAEEVQDIAYSTDGGYTFTKYEQNPVISIGSTQFRDPKVLWHPETQKWVMVIAYAQDLVIGFYTSPDLKEWTHASNFTQDNIVGDQFECPNLLLLPVDGTDELLHVLFISVNPGAPLGGSITQYLTGKFDGTVFEPVDTDVKLTDFAMDNYAGQIFYGTLGHSQVSIAWANNWDYTNEVPTGELEGWRSAMSLPRQHSLKDLPDAGYTLISSPYDLSPVRDVSLAKGQLEEDSIVVNYANVSSGALYFEIHIASVPTTGTTGSIDFNFTSSVSGESLSGGIAFGTDSQFWINRGAIRGFTNDLFDPEFTTPVTSFPDGIFSFSAVIDRSILEVFLNGGEQSATSVFYPIEILDRLEIVARDLDSDITASAEVWSLKSTW
jgi:beta-fructofuranosidase